MNMDFIKYPKLKASGALVLQKIGTRAVLHSRSFNPETGLENPIETGNISPVELLEARKQAQALLDGIDVMIADVKALGVEVEPLA